ncbi:MULTISPECIES: xanthine dehydrogenase family protein molybdopterin-binding subunit [unclassified Roseateles]|uniref:xanthine dehydrogenase family protein molybdopterin-binding subunit n=1 Tax=unclassified Roseateles TaxID=2626991 RepID=UPI000A4EDDAC|nr:MULTISPECIES: molybdopterin cofactor-binding domain-containing protein [unclassified Roseateles]
MLNPRRIDQVITGGLSRRAFVTTTVGGAVGLALLPGVVTAQGAPAKPGAKPTEQPLAFVTIAKDGTTTILCNRMDMGQGIETGLAMICAEELDADWSKVRTGFGDQRGEYVDPLFGMHLTGGSNSVKNSYQQYRELGARSKAMLVAAAAQAWGVPAASLKAENGVISGGGKSAGYGEFFDAAMKLPVPEAVALKDPKTFKLIGQPTTLVVAKDKSTGAQAYGIDVQLPGMAVAVIQRPPVFNGKIAKLDLAEAMKVKGVKAVVPVTLDRGGQGVAVVASGYWAAKKGRDALKVDWDLGGVAKADTAALTKQYLALAKTPGTPAPKPEFQADVSGWSKAPKKITADFVFPYLNHAQMEPLACTVDLKADRCDVYYAAQMPGLDAMAIAKTVGLKPEQVQINVQMAGGGFGRRATPASEWPREAAAVAVALAQAGQRMPVKVIWSREDDVKAGYYRPMTVHRAEIGFDAAGKVAGWQHRIVSQSILKGSPLEGFGYQKGVDGTTTEGMRDPYAIPMNLSVHHPDVNVPVLWWRSVGATHTAYVMETLVDEIAFATKQDPVAYRMKLMDGNAKADRHRAALQAAVDKSGYGKRKLKAGQAWGVALHESFESVVAYVVVASMKGKGKDRQPVLQEVHAGVHCNLCINPRAVETQVQGAAIMALATTMPTHHVTFKDGVVEQNNFYDMAMPRITDAPKVMTVSVVPSNDPPKGMGEPGLPALAPALANAVARLTGKRQRELPFSFA